MCARFKPAVLAAASLRGASRRGLVRVNNCRSPGNPLPPPAGHHLHPHAARVFTLRCTPTPPASSPCYRLRGRAAADATTQGTPLLPRLLSSASFTESTFHRGRRCRGRAGRRTRRGGTLQGAHQAAEALQAGFDGGAPAPGVHALEAAVNNLLAREHETRCMNVHATCPRTSGGRKEIYRKTEIQNLVPSQHLVPERKSSIHNQCVCSVN